MAFGRKKKTTTTVTQELVITHDPASAPARVAEDPFTLVPGGKTVSLHFTEA